ncbi:heme-binding protein [Candidatus Puniceispirillum sp.]|nr:heme-binding protein [Candidatus Puniceispirillum sp.]
MRLKISLELEVAVKIVSVVLSTGRVENMLPLTVVVLDVTGKIIASQSEDGSGLMRFDIARGKAWGSLGMGMSSRLIRDRLATRLSFQTSLATVSDGKFVPVPGGVLILQGDGVVVGAVGVSGDTSEKDEYCAITGIAAMGLLSEPSVPDKEWYNSSLSDSGNREH